LHLLGGSKNKGSISDGINILLMDIFDVASGISMAHIVVLNSAVDLASLLVTDA
jgi:hypothetical protein